MREKYDVIVVGAGVVGTTVAYELGSSGAHVLLVDAASDIGGGCSYANAGIIAPSHVGPLATTSLLLEGARQIFARPPAVRVRPQPSLGGWLAQLVASARPSRVRVATRRLQELAATSAQLHEDYAKRGINPSYRRTGAIDVWMRTPAPDGAMSPQQARQAVPALGALTGALLDPDESVIDSRAYLRGLLDAARCHNIEVRFGQRVRTLLTQRRNIVGIRCEAGDFAAGVVVLAAGLGIAPLAAQAGVRVPLRGGRGYVIDLAVSGHVPTMPVRLKERRIVITPFGDRLRVCGLMEFGAERRPLDPRTADAMVAVAAEALPGVHIDDRIDTWCGERPCTPDGLPVIGASTRAPGLVVAGGHGMWGLILAPVTAQLLTQGLQGYLPATSGPLADPLLSPDRFGPMRRGVGRPGAEELLPQSHRF
ncbi:FAD-dependent oxidoreductase [Micromonospora sp. NPDC047548]|uniref:NAD(P)/FAD-dependent oxidoreductase n=1 Tax=Micromonospora sp. NPDC047548 TaxID=3155624 RepID=UPI0033E30795